MELIVWRENFETGFSRVDNQHRYLVELINKLFTNMGSKGKEENLKTIFMELYGYTINHFSMEESLMLEFNYPDYDGHKKEHAAFIDKINEFKNSYLKGEAKVNVELVNYLKDWLLKHILGTDRKTFAGLMQP